MKLRSKIGTLLAIRGADRRLVCEATVMLRMARLVVLSVPFRLIALWLRRAPETSAYDEASLLRARRAVTIAERNVPWNAVRQPQAMAAKAKPAWGGCGSAFQLGATFDRSDRLIAHAWLVAGSEIIVGAAGIPGMSPLARFG